MQGYARRGYLYQNPAMRDVNCLVAVLDEQYYYDEDGYLRAGRLVKLLMKYPYNNE